ncbi:general substrate transporter [Leucosporidium creatinivorum]|uniref:General substrate transporter n=1 Tax=Leucosporidium creatinivorum TaxID=106004 RepID=A0A1Y2ERV5_9BASI|nr:general substrate transporter [Leucosporidium creatinivorum]
MAAEAEEKSESLPQAAPEPTLLLPRRLILFLLPPVNFFTYFLSCCAALSGFLFGYDTGVISGALVNIGTDIGGQVLTTTEKEWVATATACGALIGGLVGGNLVDTYGRKWILALGDVFFVVGAILIASSYHLVQITLGRVVLGLGVGIAAAVTPLYLAELAPTRLRGNLITIQSLMITGGQIAAYALGAGFETFRGGWRGLFGISILPALIQAGFIHYLPESPRYDVIRGREDLARQTMRLVYTDISDDIIELKLNSIRETVNLSNTFQERWPVAKRPFIMFKTGAYRRPLIAACGLMAFQQLSGFNSLLYYSATIFQAAGFNNASAVGLIVAGTNFVFTCVSMGILDRLGKRRTMLITYPGMILGLALAAVAFHFMTETTGGILVAGSDYPMKWTGLMLGMIVFFIASYATGLGNVPWHTSELFPLEVRGMGSSALTASCWAANILISATFLTLMNSKTGAAGAFGIYAGICLLGMIFVYFCFPEVSNLSLEEIQQLFSEDFGIQKSRVIRREHRAARHAARDARKLGSAEELA